MDTAAWLAYGGYLAWLLAGTGDFACHRRTDLPTTSGVTESFAHLLQLAILGAAIVLGLAFETGRAMLVVLCALVVAHAVIGYLDTRIAFARRRVILPIEQHLHSVLDIAPFVAFGTVLGHSWQDLASGDWSVALRDPPLPIAVWIAVIFPAAVLCVTPALMEFVAASNARRGERARTQTGRKGAGS